MIPQEPVPRKYKSDVYCIEWIALNGIVRIRWKSAPKKHMFQFGKGAGHLDRDAKQQLGEECLMKLDGGMKTKDVQAWVDEMCT